MKLLKYLVLVPLVTFEILASPSLSHGVETFKYEIPAKRTIPGSHIQHEKRTEEQGRRWVKFSQAQHDAKLPMRIGLKQRNLQEGHDLLMDISDPNSESYGKHLSAAQVIDLFAPSDDSVDAVTQWLVTSGIPRFTISQSSNKQWIQFDAPVRKVEELLMADYHVYKHRDTGVKNVACEEYHVPKGVQEHIDYITPGIKLMGFGDPQDPIMAKRSTGPDGQGPARFALPVETVPANSPIKLNGDCDRYITPDCIRNLYQIPNGTKAHPDNKMGIFQSLGQHYAQEDLDTFFWAFTENIPNGTHPELRSINGGEGPAKSISSAGAESNLDFQMAYGLIWPQQTVLFQVDDEYYQYNQTTSNTPYRGFFNNLWNALDGSYCLSTSFNETGNCVRPACLDPSYPNPNPGGYQGELMCGVYSPTNVISISYSGGEIDLPASYQQRQCAEIMKLGLQGTTVLIASGDSGVASFSGDPLPDGCVGERHEVFHPQFVANCPYVLAVGSTYLPSGKFEAADEVPTERFASGGGFSNVFDRPAWQERHVKGFLASANLSFEGYEGGGENYSNVYSGKGRYNKLGRAYPDVAANGDNLVISHGGELIRIGGTSASCPLFGSILNLINEERLAVGKSTVGFVHQVLYEHPELFTDITTGNNPGCGTKGFPATKGWDPVSGFGTPVYPKFLELFMSLP
ncbi:alkaline serine protease [Pseudomassariella vexata]|uniref:Alkaline serine protease n=1 Tax=Pseudomassariella vexata TaxID=1141098 RepID=A0A1Y2DC48_9PEZI|nr:alkaline serine protease [Pseudomassariella vexata]ORY56843.1 alkaline serine protease [Pseudomassariella vexata]